MARDRIQELPRKSLSQLEGDDWGDAPDGATPLIKKVHALRHKPVSDLSDEDLRLLLGQGEGLQWLVPIALERLELDPCASGDMAPGALREQVARVSAEYWQRHAAERTRLESVPGCDEE
ncbi:contact-dependent growth inhibition system immunity protein [Nocardioides sp. J9]|uniref:contact-dependent growth inhibition system immunity protein n=1 Tax=Nocardioides sp. J9 TaxID=935844 RepID=UPI0011A71407|nr:contact-dependent growth inhibition system immunity protein [Nocardioides sp. J9]